VTTAAVATLRDLLRLFLDHRKTVIIRPTRLRLRRAEEGAHIVEACSRDRHARRGDHHHPARSPYPARGGDRLMANFGFSKVQADAISTCACSG